MDDFEEGRKRSEAKKLIFFFFFSRTFRGVRETWRRKNCSCMRFGGTGNTVVRRVGLKDACSDSCSCLAGTDVQTDLTKLFAGVIKRWWPKAQ